MYCREHVIAGKLLQPEGERACGCTRLCVKRAACGSMRSQECGDMRCGGWDGGSASHEGRRDTRRRRYRSGVKPQEEDRIGAFQECRRLHGAGQIQQAETKRSGAACFREAGNMARRRVQSREWELSGCLNIIGIAPVSARQSCIKETGNANKADKAGELASSVPEFPPAIRGWTEASEI